MKDYRKLAAEARDQAVLRRGYPLEGLFSKLADAIDALCEERDSLYKSSLRNNDELDALTKERDALREALGGKTRPPITLMFKDCIIIFCTDCGILTSPDYLLSEPWTEEEEEAMREYLLFVHRKTVHADAR